MTTAPPSDAYFTPAFWKTLYLCNIQDVGRVRGFSVNMNETLANITLKLYNRLDCFTNKEKYPEWRMVNGDMDMSFVSVSMSMARLHL